MRRFDGALAAHGRDTGYATEVWYDEAFEPACARAGSLADTAHPPALASLVTGAARVAATVTTNLRRDRLGVPERLSENLGTLLILYAATLSR